MHYVVGDLYAPLGYTVCTLHSAVPYNVLFNVPYSTGMYRQYGTGTVHYHTDSVQ